MDDLIKQLRGRAAFCRDRGEQKTPGLCEQAAAALAEAKSEIERLSGELRYIAEATDMYEPCGWAVHRARAALTSPPKDK